MEKRWRMFTSTFTSVCTIKRLSVNNLQTVFNRIPWLSVATGGRLSLCYFASTGSNKVYHRTALKSCQYVISIDIHLF